MGRKRKGRRNANSVRRRKQLDRKDAKREAARERGLEDLRERISGDRYGRLNLLDVLSHISSEMSEEDEDEN